MCAGAFVVVIDCCGKTKRYCVTPLSSTVSECCFYSVQQGLLVFPDFDQKANEEQEESKLQFTQ